MTNHAANAGQHCYAERGLDLYETPAAAVEALLRVEKLPARIWEPACGRGAIVNVLRAHGHEVVASDIANYGIPITPPGYWGRDFLREMKAPDGTEAILTNPPYRLAEEFIAHALKLVPLTIALLPLRFLASERRRGILEGGKLARVHIFRKRLPMMHRDGWTGPRASSSIDFAWFTWSADHAGSVVVDRISAERSETS